MKPVPAMARRVEVSTHGGDPYHANFVLVKQKFSVDARSSQLAVDVKRALAACFTMLWPHDRIERCARSTPSTAGAVLRVIREGARLPVPSWRADRPGALHGGAAGRRAAQARARSYEAGGQNSTGGRPPTLAFNDGGAWCWRPTSARPTRAWRSPTSAARRWPRSSPTSTSASGPDAVLDWCTSASAELLDEVGRPTSRGARHRDRRPGPVAFRSGEPVNPPIMPGWDGFSIPDWFAGRYDAPVLVDNDVNIMALGEHWTHWRDAAPALHQGRNRHRLRHRRGGAHPPRRRGRGRRHRPHPPRRPDDVVCRCGNVGCLEAVSGGGAPARGSQRRRHRGEHQPRRRAPRQGRDPARPGWSARPAATSARCWPGASTSSTPR